MKEWEESRSNWKKKRNDYDGQIQCLIEQVEELHTETEHVKLHCDQHEKEVNIKLLEAEAKWNKEKRDHISLKEHYDNMFTDLNRITEQLQSAKQRSKSELAQSEAICQELTEENSRINKELLDLKEQIELIEKQYETEKIAAEKKQQGLYGFTSELQEKLAISESEKLACEDQKDKVTKTLQESKDHLSKEKQRWTKQLQSFDLVRKTMMSQLQNETARADEGCSELAKLKREVASTEHTIDQYRHKLQYVEDRLQAVSKD